MNLKKLAERKIEQVWSIEEEELLRAHLLGFLLPREVSLPGQRSFQGNSAPALLSRQRGSKRSFPIFNLKHYNLICNCFLFSLTFALLMGPGAGFRNSPCPPARIGAAFLWEDNLALTSTSV